MGRLLTISPWTRETLELRDFGRFPWEEDKADEPATPQKTAEEIKREDEEILKMIQGNG